MWTIYFLHFNWKIDNRKQQCKSYLYTLLFNWLIAFNQQNCHHYWENDAKQKKKKATTKKEWLKYCNYFKKIIIIERFSLILCRWPKRNKFFARIKLCNFACFSYIAKCLKFRDWYLQTFVLTNFPHFCNSRNYVSAISNF